MCKLVIDNKIISTPLLNIILDIKKELNDSKLKNVKVSGDNIQLTCPFHKDGKENKPSSYVYIGEKSDKVNYGDFHCFTCGEKGPFYHFVAQCFDISDNDARQWLVDNYADEIIEYELDLPEIDLSPKIQNNYLSEDCLKGLEDFHPYMIQRKLTKEVCKQFEVKYDPKLKMLVFPVRDEFGKLVMLTKRSVENKTFIIDANKEKPVYLLYYLMKNNIQEAYICESQINALTL